jgi:hypothetical protein
MTMPRSIWTGALSFKDSAESEGSEDCANDPSNRSHTQEETFNDEVNHDPFGPSRTANRTVHGVQDVALLGPSSSQHVSFFLGFINYLDSSLSQLAFCFCAIPLTTG